MRLVSALVILLTCAPYNTYALPWPFDTDDTDAAKEEKKALRGSDNVEEDAIQEIEQAKDTEAEAEAMLTGLVVEEAEEKKEKVPSPGKVKQAAKDDGEVETEEVKTNNGQGQEKQAAKDDEQDGEVGEEKENNGNSYGEVNKPEDGGYAKALGKPEDQAGEKGGNAYAYAKGQDEDKKKEISDLEATLAETKKTLAETEALKEKTGGNRYANGQNKDTSGRSGGKKGGR